MLHTGENCMAIYVDFLLRCLGIMVSKNKLHAKGQPNNEINNSSMYKMKVFTFSREISNSRIQGTQNTEGDLIQDAGWTSPGRSRS